MWSVGVSLYEGKVGLRDAQRKTMRRDRDAAMCRWAAAAQTKECLGPPQVGEAGRTDPSRFQREGGPATTFIPDRWSPDCATINVCCSKPPSLWYFVTDATGNEYYRVVTAQEVITPAPRSSWDYVRS